MNEFVCRPFFILLNPDITLQNIQIAANRDKVYEGVCGGCEEEDRRQRV